MAGIQLECTPNFSCPEKSANSEKRTTQTSIKKMISKFGNKSMQASHEVQKSVNILQSNPDSEADFESI